MPNKTIKRRALIAGILFVCLLSVGYWIHGQFFVSTDDAYVNANIVQVAARVSGQVQHLFVTNNQFVKEGTLLFDVDPEPFQAAYDQAKAQLDMNQAKLELAEVTAARTATLVKKKFASPQENDSAISSLHSAQAAVQLSKANLTQAELNLRYTKVIAPTTGWVTNFTLRVGDSVNTNAPLFALISNSTFWVDANFKETEIEKLHPGQHATIEIDMYPSHPFRGIVESISGGSGTVFSLLPPENATGNWVKVTQRVPVRVTIEDPDAAHPLRIGTTASVTVPIHFWS